ncbi:4a-hydroxytetrahydrobiopterin dehydratase [Candidatus Woesearchaeota archaeon]|nr:4a-hydroxytetrahydrobiopterin dehydratase [Candidatus Woesearchaeota archaeon]
MNELAKKKCVPCMGGVPPLKGRELEQIYGKLGNGWQLANEHHIEKEYSFSSFREALDFTVKVGELAEEEGHHPEILLAFRKVKLTLWTHKIGGLTESDFVFAAKADEILG